MKKFDYSALFEVTKVLKEQAIGQFINRFFLVSEQDFFFDLSKKQQGLFISLNAPNPFIDLTKEKLNLPRCKKESHLTTIITHHIEKARIVDVTLIEGEKVVTITLSKHYENLTTRTLLMHIELITSHPNLIITDEANVILGVYKSSKDFTGDRVLRIGQTYTHKPLLNKFSLTDTTQHDAYATRYLDEERLRINKKNHTKLFNHISNALKRLTIKKDKIKQEIDNLIDSDLANLYGQLLLTYTPEILTSEITLDEYTFTVDPTLDAIRNATLWFNKAKKSRVSLQNKKNQLEIIEEELNYYDTLSQQIKNLNDDELNEVAIELGLSLLQKAKSKETPTFKPYFLLFNNVKIGFGRNNLQNDYLSFKLANKSHTFMHIKDYSGAHIVIFDDNPKKEITEYAARLGLILAKLPSAEFHYTKCKDIKKGRFPGQVIFKENPKSIYIKSDDKQIEIDLRLAKRF